MCSTSSCSLYFCYPLTYFDLNGGKWTGRVWFKYLFLGLDFVFLSPWKTKQLPSVHTLWTVWIILHFTLVWARVHLWSKLRERLSLLLIPPSYPSWQQQCYKPGQINSCWKPNRQSWWSVFHQFQWRDSVKVCDNRGLKKSGLAINEKKQLEYRRGETTTSFYGSVLS